MTQKQFEKMLSKTVRENQLDQFNRLCDDYPEYLKEYLNRVEAETDEIAGLDCLSDENEAWEDLLKNYLMVRYLDEWKKR